MKIEVSNGELIDKLCILQIKAERISSPDKLNNISKELNVLQTAAAGILPLCQSQFSDLKKINEKLWDIENRIREMEQKNNFDHSFIQTAREVYRNNDIRASLKKEINNITNSELTEVKSYKNY